MVMGVPLATNTKKYCFGVFGSMPMEFNTQTDVVFFKLHNNNFNNMCVCYSKLGKNSKECSRGTQLDQMI